MNLLEAMRIYVRVVERESISGAATGPQYRAAGRKRAYRAAREIPWLPAPAP